MDPSRATYNNSGVLQCPTCAATTQIAQGDERASASVMGSAVGVLIGGILSVTCFNPFLIVSIITVVSGVSWLVMIARNPQLRKRMGGKLVPAILAAVGGVLLGGFPLLVVGLAAIGLTLRANPTLR